MTQPARARRIAVLLQSLEGGGAQRRMVELINGFAASGRTIDLFLVDGQGELREQLASNVRVLMLDRNAPAQSLADHLSTDPPDALLAGAAAVHDIAVKALRQGPHIPLVLRASSHPLRTFPWIMVRQRLAEMQRRRARMRRYAAADLIIAVADDIAASIRQALPAAPIVVIRNPVITPSFLAGATAPVALPWPEDRGIPLIVGVGRLAVAKDFPTLLRSFALLRARRPARLAILGSGTGREIEHLQRLARRLGIAGDFALPGSVDHIAAWLRRADLFVSSSLWEGSAGALIEALAMGCPVVATDCVGSARDLLQHGRLGRLVPPREPKAMAEAMVAELDRPVDRALLAAAAEPYRAADQASEYLAAIDACLCRVKQ